MSMRRSSSNWVPSIGLTKSLVAKLTLKIEQIWRSGGADAWKYTLFRAPNCWVPETKLLDKDDE